MSSHPKNIKLLEEINNIDKDYSEDDQEISALKVIQREIIMIHFTTQTRIATKRIF